MKNIIWMFVFLAASAQITVTHAEADKETSIISVNDDGSCKAQTTGVSPGFDEYVYKGSCEDFNEVMESTDSQCDVDFVAQFGGLWKSKVNTIDIGHNTLDYENVLMILQRNAPTPSVGGTIYVLDKKIHKVRNERLGGRSSVYKAYCVPKAGLIVVDFLSPVKAVFQVLEENLFEMKWSGQKGMFTKTEL